MKAVAKKIEATGCALPTGIEWHSINWVKCHETVKRLQARIVKATQEGKWGKVKSLQHLLTHSLSGKALAVKRVTENQGKRTPGVDKEIWSTPESKTNAIKSLKEHGYKPQPLRRVYIPKANGKKRPLGIPTMKDRAMQALHLQALDPVSETNADLNSYGFRKERSCHDAIEQCFKALSMKSAAQWVMEGDIKGCFDNISHEWMNANIPLDKTLLQKWLKSGYIEKRKLFPTNAGTPQGGIISPVLANMTLDGLQALLNEHFHGKTIYGGGKQQWVNPKVNLIRYADDFVITGESKELLENEIKPLVERFLTERGLALSTEKTKITHIEEGFDFLGQNVRKYDGKLLIKPSQKSVTDFKKKIRTLVKKLAAADQTTLIRGVNPIITGWLNYHRHVCSSKTFGNIQSWLWETTWRWAKRRHPLKNAQWIKDKYYHHNGKRDWNFGVKESGNRYFNLINPKDVRIIRHPWLQTSVNPYDPKWEEYFEKRFDLKVKGSLVRKRKILALWNEQGGICPLCKQKIKGIIESENGEDWHSHHIIPKSEGGLDENSNRVLLHPNCHRQVHSQGLKVVKPALQKKSLERLEPCEGKLSSTVLRGEREQQCLQPTRLTVFYDIDINHVATASKDRTSLFDNKYFTPSTETGIILINWLNNAPDAKPLQAAKTAPAATKDNKQTSPKVTQGSSTRYADLFIVANALKLSDEDYKYYCYQRYGLHSMAELTDGQIAEQVKLLDSLKKPERLTAFRDILKGIENERLAAQVAQNAAAATQVPTAIAHTVQ